MQPSRRYSFVSQASNYHRKNQKQLIQFLKSEFGFNHSLSNLIISIHQCSDMAELMSLFVFDEENHYAHIFVPDREDMPNALCRACQSNRAAHSHEITWAQLEKFESQLSNQDLIADEEEKLYNSFSDGNNYGESNLVGKNDLFYEQQIKPQKMKKVYKYITCTICYGNYSEQQIIKIGGTVHQVCQNCMSEYLKQQILNLRILNIKCPHCGVALSQDIIKQFVNHTLFQKYQTFLRNIEIQKNPNFKWCPNPKCSVVISINKKKKTAKCPKCQTQVCTRCNREAHPKQSCDQVLKNVFKGLQNASDIQKCKKCKALVQKIAGCNHMTCGVCKYEWCWLCGATYSDIHFSPLNPIGCAGMQNRNISGFAKCKIYILRVLMIIGFLILLPIIAPIVMVFCGPVLLYNFLVKKVCRYYGCCFNMFMALISLPLGLAIDPFVWIGAIIYFIPFMYQNIKNWLERRRTMIQGSQNQITRKLLQEGDAVVVAQS